MRLNWVGCFALIALVRGERCDHYSFCSQPHAAHVHEGNFEFGQTFEGKTCVATQARAASFSVSSRACNSSTLTDSSRPTRLRVDLTTATSVPRSARPPLSWNRRPKSCEALICYGRGAVSNHIQFNTIQKPRFLRPFFV